MTTQSQGLSQADPRRWMALALLCLANFMVIMDTSIIGVALPAIKEALGYSQESLQWVFNAYVIFFGGFLLLGGRLSDLFGQKRMFMWGFLILTAASLLAGLAWNDTVLNIGRALQGFGSALIAPSALTIVMMLFSGNPKELGKALGFWGHPLLQEVPRGVSWRCHYRMAKLGMDISDQRPCRNSCPHIVSRTFSKRNTQKR